MTLHDPPRPSTCIGHIRRRFFSPRVKLSDIASASSLPRRTLMLMSLRLLLSLRNVLLLQKPGSVWGAKLRLGSILKEVTHRSDWPVITMRQRRAANGVATLACADAVARRRVYGAAAAGPTVDDDDHGVRRR